MKIKKFKYQGEEATVYLLTLDKPVKIYGTDLPKGKFILKRYIIKPRFNLKWMNKLSDLYLTPKVYYAKDNTMIMQYIKGITMHDFVEKKTSLNVRRKVFSNTVRLLMKWHKFRKLHCDLNLYNILVTKKYDVFFIDPMVNKCAKSTDFNEISSLEYDLGLRNEFEHREKTDLKRWKEMGYIT